MKTTNLYGKKTGLVVALIVALTISLFLSLGTGFTAQRAHADGATVGEMGMNLTLNDSVAANFHVYGVENNKSGLYMEFTFLGETTRSATQTGNGELVFTYYGITPQYFNERITAKLFEVGTGEGGADKLITVKKRADSDERVESIDTTVKENLTALLDSENGTFASGYQYLAMRKLAVDMLNYGAAAQTYKEIAGDHVNAHLKTEKVLSPPPLKRLRAELPCMKVIPKRAPIRRSYGRARASVSTPNSGCTSFSPLRTKKTSSLP